MNTLPIQERAKFHVLMWIKVNFPHVKVKDDDIVVSWFSKTLKNWKACIFVTSFPGFYFEVTYNGDSRETYLDVYEKLDNVLIPDEAPMLDVDSALRGADMISPIPRHESYE